MLQGGARCCWLREAPRKSPASWTTTEHTDALFKHKSELTGLATAAGGECPDPRPCKRGLMCKLVKKCTTRRDKDAHEGMHLLQSRANS